MNDKKIAAYDLETIRNPYISDETINSLCKTGGLTDPAKIEKKRAEFKSKMGMNPLTAMAVTGAWYASEDNQGYIQLRDTSPVAEKEFLIEYWNKLAEFDLLIGFNSLAFDAKILLLRAAVHGINIPFKIDCKRYSTTGNHLDLRMLLTNWNNFEPGKLSFYLSLFGLEGKTEGMDGSLVQSYFDEGLFDEIGIYCQQDCKQTYQLFERIKHYFL